jgi:transposase-like protein
MTYPSCPSCGSATEFLGNESETGKSWFKCKASQRVFSLKLEIEPRFMSEVPD